MRLPRLGLQARITASYVLVTAAVVVLVEGVALGVVLPNLQAQDDLVNQVDNTASSISDKLGNSAGATGSLPNPVGQIGSSDVSVPPGRVVVSGKGLAVPQVDGSQSSGRAMTLALVLSPAGTVLASSYPHLFPVGSDASTRLPTGWSEGGHGIAPVAGDKVAWATAAVFPYDLAGEKFTGSAVPNGKGPDKSSLLGFVYVQAPLQAAAGLPATAFQPLLQTAIVLLAATLPVGVFFGLLTTRGSVRRLRRLADGTTAFATGNFSARVPASGHDEIAQLAARFNEMAIRIEGSIADQRALAERNARLAERSRISRELHDSISQDLFSLSTLAAGLAKALPTRSPLQPQLQTLTATVGSMIQEMRALLLELRPTALDEKGLVPALEDLCQAYEERVGVRVVKELELVRLDSASEHAVFRVAQEGLANAARHAEAGEIALRLHPREGGAELVVADNGRGFDRRRNAGKHGLGLKMMAERVQELGGSVAIESRPGRGTEVRVRLPGLAT